VFKSVAELTHRSSLCSRTVIQLLHVDLLGPQAQSGVGVAHTDTLDIAALTMRFTQALTSSFTYENSSASAGLFLSLHSSK
jgi:hypothetical protein